MVCTTKRINHTLSFILCLALLCTPHKTTTSGWDAGFSMAVGGLALAALGGALCYACSESDEAATTRAEQDATQAARCYQAEADALCAFHDITSYPLPSAQSLYVDELNELYPTAQNLVARGFTISEYRNQLNTCIHGLRSDFSNIEHRKNKLARKINRTMEETLLLDRMQRVYDTMKSLLPLITLYYDFLTLHRAYFELYEYEAKLCIVYQQELAYGHAYPHDPLSLGNALRHCVGARFAAQPYPYTAYKHALDNDIQKLQALISKARRYPHRYTAAVQLEQYLIRVRGIILADTIYLQEKEMRIAERHYQQQQQLIQQQIITQQQLLAAQRAYDCAVARYNQQLQSNR